MNRFEEQCQVATRTRAFFDAWGLKRKYVASVCMLTESTLSKFLSCERTLSAPQLARLTAYMDEYERRNAVDKV